MIRITNIQRGCVNDGPGIRTTVFLYGCSLRCPWCCNPETWASTQFSVDKSRCLYSQGIESTLCDGCAIKGGKNPEDKCMLNAIHPIAKEYTPESLFAELKPYFSQMAATSGGVTFSGGEPLLQTPSLLPLLSLLKDSNINICFETTLVATVGMLKMIIPYADEFIIDLKLQPEMMLGDEIYLNNIKRQLEIISPEKRLTFRLVYVDSVYDNKSDVLRAIKYIGLTDIEILKVHNLAEAKYRNLGIPFTEFTAEDRKLADFCNCLSQNGTLTTLLSV